ncbi:MAG: hypothetical protein RLZZ324_166 [Candidatus Parcubacteria bacterium]|jgi:diadenosine hexaphosphate hydrolase (ATP-forming)
MPIAKAGAIVISRTDPTKVLVLYRAHQGDWSFPKGHVDPGETAVEAMHREVREETGLDVEVVRPLAPLRYVDSLGKESELEMWLTRSRDDADLRPEMTGDAFDWVDADRAGERLTHANLREWYGTHCRDILG